MNRLVWCTGLLAVVAVIGTGCGDKPLADSSDNSNENKTEVVTVPEEQAPTTNASGGNGTVNNESVDKGNVDSSTEANGNVDKGNVDKGNTETNQASSKKETITVYYTDTQEMELKQSKQEISYKDDLQKYDASFKALQSSGSDELIPLWGKVELKSLEMKDGAITMDIHLPDEARLGSGGEMFALEALQNTLFQFDEVKSIELLVDGQQVESLMGHVDLEHPMTKK